MAETESHQHDQIAEEEHSSGHSAHSHGGGGHEEGHEGAPEWLISFADNVALIMGFFVILLAMNMGPKGATVNNTGEPGHEGVARQADWVLALRNGFNSPIDMTSNNPEEEWLRKRIREKQIGRNDQDGPHGRSDKLQAPRPTDYTRVTAAVLFDDRSSLLSQDSRQTLAEVS